jgi:hypothetical protein
MTLVFSFKNQSGTELPDIANKNTGPTVTSHISDKKQLVFSISVSHTILGDTLILKKMIPCSSAVQHLASCVLPGSPGLSQVPHCALL